MTTLNIDGSSVDVGAKGARNTDMLLYVLRDKLGITGPKYGCGVGVCGACTCISENAVGENGGYDGPLSGTQPKSSAKKFRPCVTSVAKAATLGSIRTIEVSEANGGNVLRAVRAAWTANDVAQCGFCQAGQIMAATEYLERKVNGTNKTVTDAEITKAMQANLCRCGTYVRIRAAIKEAAGALQLSVA